MPAAITHSATALLAAAGAGGETGASPPLTYAAEAIVVGILIVGLLLWIYGRTLVRPLFGLLFAGVGGLAGATVPMAIGLAVHPAIMMGVGVVVGLLVGLMLFRVSMAIALATLLSAALPVATGVTLQVAPNLIQAMEAPPEEAEGAEEGLPLEDQFLADVPVEGEERTLEDAARKEVEKRATDEVRERTERAIQDLTDGVELTDEDKEALRARMERVERFVRAVFEEAKAAWADRPAAHRLAMALAAAIGLLAGGSIGLLAPRSTAAVTTALIGAATWLGAAMVLIEAHDLPIRGVAPTRPAAWLGVWLIAAGIGAGIQWTGGRRRADKAES
jgi:hypothetical protein